MNLNFLERHIQNTTDTPLSAAFEDDDKPPALIDPLRFGTQAFVDAVRAGSMPPVTGQDGRIALDLALKIEEAAQALRS